MGRRQRKRMQRRLAMFTAWLVVAQHALLNVVFALDPYRPALIEVPELWAIDRRWQFYLLVGVMLGSLSLTVAAWRMRQPVRLTLTVSWLIFIALMYGAHLDRLEVMVRLMIHHA